MVGGLEPGGGSLSGLVLADLVTGQTGDLGRGGDFFPALFFPAMMVASHGAGSEFPTADGSVNVPPQTNYEKKNNVDPNGST